MNPEANLYWIQAEVSVPAVEPLARCAARLNSLARGFVLRPDSNCRFDEVPAFIAQFTDLELILFGMPPGETATHYFLKLSALSKRTPQSWQALLAETFIGALYAPKPPAESGYLDFSEELAQYLQQSGIRDCTAG
jgi:hypothetical protein